MTICEAQRYAMAMTICFHDVFGYVSGDGATEDVLEILCEQF